VRREFLLSLDLGTTRVRALVIDAAGRARSRAYSPLAVSYPSPGRVEQDATDMWERSVGVMRRAIEEAGIAARDLAGIGVVNQRGAAVAWDARTMAPMAPVIGWQDTRTAPRVADFRALGIPLNTLASATKYEWWMQNDTAVREAAAARTLRLGTPDTWLTAKLTWGAAHITDPGNASSTALYDNAAGEWSTPIVDLFSVPAEALAEVVASNGVVGETHASLLGAPVPVAARAGDQQAAMFGQGAHNTGDAKITLGTSAMLDVHTGDAVADAPPGAHALSLWRLTDGTRAYCLEGTVITAGSAVEWLVDLGLVRDAEEVSALAESVATSGGVVFVPALQGLGTPFADDGARAAFYGLTRGTGRAHIARAVLEGIAHRCVDVGEAFGLGDVPLRVDGGLARSAPLLQMIADYSGREVVRAAEVEATAVGAAFLAGLATGVFSTPEGCRRLITAPVRLIPVIGADARAAMRTHWAAAVQRARRNHASVPAT
jgi:glycerol kinase